MIRPTFNMYDEDESVLMPDVTSKLGPEELLKIQLKGYGSNVDVLATELYDLLSKDKLEESKELIDQFYNDHYANIDEDVEFKTEKVEEKPPEDEKTDGQVTFKEVLE